MPCRCRWLSKLQPLLLSPDRLPKQPSSTLKIHCRLYNNGYSPARASFEFRWISALWFQSNNLARRTGAECVQPLTPGIPRHRDLFESAGILITFLNRRFDKRRLQEYQRYALAIGSRLVKRARRLLRCRGFNALDSRLDKQSPQMPADVPISAVAFYGLFDQFQ